MTDTLEVEIRGLDRLLKKFGLGATPLLRTLTRGVAEELKAELARYPGPVKLPIPWVSNKQRAAYFAKRRGLGPYVRQSDPFSQRLGPSWATESRGEASAAVGTRVTYAPLVQGAKTQQPMHANTGWVTDEQAVQRVNESKVAEKMLDDLIRKW